MFFAARFILSQHLRTFFSIYIETALNFDEECNEFADLLLQRLSLCLSRLCHPWHSLIRSLYFRACLPEGVGPQEGEVTCGGSTHLTCKRDHIKMRDCMTGGLPQLPGAPHLHVNRPLFKFIFLYLCYIPPHSCAFHKICFTPIFFIYVYHHAEYYFSYSRWCGWPGKARKLIFIINFTVKGLPWTITTF